MSASIVYNITLNNYDDLAENISLIQSKFVMCVINDSFLLQVPLNNSGTLSPNHSQKSSPDFYIIKVTYETDCVETDGIVLYKSIMLSNNERTPQVIRNAMYKLGLEGNPDSYTLAQVLPEKGMHFSYLK